LLRQGVNKRGDSLRWLDGVSVGHVESHTDAKGVTGNRMEIENKNKATHRQLIPSNRILDKVNPVKPKLGRLPAQLSRLINRDNDLTIKNTSEEWKARRYAKISGRYRARKRTGDGDFSGGGGE